MMEKSNINITAEIASMFIKTMENYLLRNIQDSNTLAIWPNAEQNDHLAAIVLSNLLMVKCIDLATATFLVDLGFSLVQSKVKYMSITTMN